MWDYLSAVATYWWTLIPGVVMAGADIVAEFRDRPVKLPRKWVLLAFLGGLVGAQALAWRDEHNKVLNQVTYMQIISPQSVIPGGPSSHVEYREGAWPFVVFVAINNGDYPANHVVESTGMVIYDFNKPFDPDAFDSTPEMEDDVWKRFLSDFKKIPPTNIEPHDRKFVSAALNRTLTKEEADGLVGRTKIIFVLALAAWNDGSGRHELERCEYIVDVPGGNSVSSRQCAEHTGLQDRAED
jgi:hypothetical protein